MRETVFLTIMNRWRMISLSVSVLLSFFAESANCQAPKINYTKRQRQAAGFWRVESPQNASVRWLAIYLGDSPETMIVRWPTGVGCQSEPADIHGSIVKVGGHFPAVIELNGSKQARLIQGQVIVHLKKTNESTNFLCE